MTHDDIWHDRLVIMMGVDVQLLPRCWLHLPWEISNSHSSVNPHSERVLMLHFNMLPISSPYLLILHPKILHTQLRIVKECVVFPAMYFMHSSGARA